MEVWKWRRHFRNLIEADHLGLFVPFVSRNRIFSLMSKLIFLEKFHRFFRGEKLRVRNIIGYIGFPVSKTFNIHFLFNGFCENQYKLCREFICRSLYLGRLGSLSFEKRAALKRRKSFIFRVVQ